MTPSIATAKGLAELLGTTVGYLLGETDEANLLKDPNPHNGIPVPEYIPWYSSVAGNLQLNYTRKNLN